MWLKKKKKYFHWWYDGNIGIKSFCCCHLLLFLHQNTTPKLCCAWNWEQQQQKKVKKFSYLSVFLACGVRRRGGGETGGGGECGILNISPSVPKFWYWTHFRKICEGKKGGEDSSAAGCIALVGWLSSVGFGIIVYYSFMIKPGAETWSSNIKSYRHVISLN